MNIKAKTNHAARKAILLAVSGLAFAALLSCGTAAQAADPPVHTAEAAGSALFGSIDISKISQSYTKAANADKQLQAMQDQYSNVLHQQSNYPMLDQTDQTALGTLLLKSAPTSDDTAMITQLEQKSSTAQQQLTNLQSTANLTPDQQNQMQQLLQLQKNSNDVLGGISNDYTNQLKQKQAEYDTQITVDIKAAINTVAKQHGLAVVFDSAVAVYCANDITDDVLKVLNK